MSTSVLGLGAVAVACSSSSSSSGGGDDGGNDTGVVTDAGGEGAACSPVIDGTTVTTIDGGALWACFNTTPACGAELTACAADCVCDNAMLLALNCVAEAGGASAPASSMMTCVVTQLSTYPGAAADTTVSALLACLTGKGLNACEPTAEGGDAPHGDAPTGDAPAGDSPTGDAPTGDAPAGDAPTGG